MSLDLHQGALHCPHVAVQVPTSHCPLLPEARGRGLGKGRLYAFLVDLLGRILNAMKPHS